MKHLSIIAFTAISTSAVWAEQVTLDGAIGPYRIEVELTRDGDAVLGRYRYDGRDNWIDVTGEVYATDAVKLTEQVDGQTTGTFYLDVIDDELKGFWAHEGTDYPANLTPVTGGVSSLLDPMENVDVSGGLTGRYTVGGYWVNDWFAPNYEIGFTGGSTNVVRLGPDEVLVQFEFIVGPTYHFAVFQGVAKRAQADTFVHDAILEGGDQPCHLVFLFEGKGVSIDDTNTPGACQFGMRAHANFSLTKVSDTAEFDGSW